MTNGLLSDTIPTAAICHVLADELFGKEQYRKLLLRYGDMRSNFDNATYDELTISRDINVWKFSSGVTPFNDYDDTTNVPIPISHPCWQPIAKGHIIASDLPTWFGAKNDKKRVMLVTQDPMPRSVKWYSKCEDAICSSPFGLHNKTWRERKNGGGRMWSLIKDVLSHNISVYLTDAYKLNLFSTTKSKSIDLHEQSALFEKILSKEIAIVKPSLIVAFGKKAHTIVGQLVPDTPLAVPHFSWRAQSAIRRFFSIPDGVVLDIESQAKLFSTHIIERLSAHQ